MRGFILVPCLFFLGTSYSLNCCKYTGGNICQNFVCCPMGGQPQFIFENNTLFCKCKLMQDCAAPPTHHPTYPPYPDFPSPPTPPPQPTTSFPSSNPPTQILTHRPTRFSPTTLRPTTATATPTLPPVTVAATPSKDNAVAFVVAGISVALFVLFVIVFCLAYRRHKLKQQSDEFVVLENSV